MTSRPTVRIPSAQANSITGRNTSLSPLQEKLNAILKRVTGIDQETAANKEHTSTTTTGDKSADATSDYGGEEKEEEEEKKDEATTAENAGLGYEEFAELNPYKGETSDGQSQA